MSLDFHRKTIGIPANIGHNRITDVLLWIILNYGLKHIRIQWLISLILNHILCAAHKHRLSGQRCLQFFRGCIFHSCPWRSLWLCKSHILHLHFNFNIIGILLSLIGLAEAVYIRILPFVTIKCFKWQYDGFKCIHLTGFINGKTEILPKCTSAH